MTQEKFEQIIAYFGESNILGIGFDNSSALTFGEGQFTLANNYNSTLGTLQFVNFDIKGNPFHVIKMVEDIQSLMIKDSAIEFSEYDRINIRS